ncbi:haloacid dehalogenase, type II [Spizellomyces punctatus DAOM BR117]|uniref:Haloacid dehalogenase, type II n=1 Tax=Spizellomyces punctatus (strain DAOM BR117) TaxID=645134 RepID=A0A0L0H7Z5_SPIPD|nr:haloacid dehalogenase, type II [Spizellomyces punctatus DAOM BR117]KNC97352.1 haloacid dehalogenase, type II [Spizellomyces punctatus DAOM BR117]|eukprot:XP_016605392.1 haloacid dehalogenase, type II [Spizellomyces punctatus DAOM BR117]
MPTATFDALGTLLSFYHPSTVFCSLFSLPPQAFQFLFATTLRDYMAASLAGSFIPLVQILESAIGRTLAIHGVEYQTRKDDFDKVVKAFTEELTLVEGGLEAIRKTADAGWKVFVVTNGGRNVVQGAIERGGLGELIPNTAIMSCDEIGVAKPHKDVYEAVKRKRDDQEIWMVAAHAWDLMGAKRRGFKTCWVEDEEKLWMAAYPPPDVRGRNLMEAVENMLAYAREHQPKISKPEA